MSAQPAYVPHSTPRRYTEAEYLAFDATAAGRWEFMDGQIIPVGEPDRANQLDPQFKAGASPAHYRLSRKLSGLLFNRLGGGCEAYQGDCRVHTPRDQSYVYPDVVILCGRPEYADPDAGLPSLLNPVVVVEILSESTAEHDRFGKFVRYRSIASLRQYVLVDSRQPRVEVLTRRDAEHWDYAQLLAADETIAFVGEGSPCRVGLGELYEQILAFPS